MENTWKKYLVLRTTIKDSETDRILDKIISKIKLTKKEIEFLKRYDEIIDSDLNDYSHLSRMMVFDKITTLLEKKKKVICNIHDRNGKIDDEIISIHNDFEKEICALNLKHGEIANITDKFLYNIFYDIKKDIYSLTVQDEYFEKIIIEDEN